MAKNRRKNTRSTSAPVEEEPLSSRVVAIPKTQEPAAVVPELGPEPERQPEPPVFYQPPEPEFEPEPVVVLQEPKPKRETRVASSESKPEPKGTKTKTRYDRIGDVLREARLERNDDLYLIAEYLCIKPAFLIALENSRYDEFPADAYVIGFLRTYANFLGVDGKQAVDRYRNEMVGRRKKPILSMPTPVTEGRAPSGIIMAGAAVALLLLYGLWYGFSSANRSEIHVPPPLPTVTQPVPVVPAADSGAAGLTAPVSSSPATSAPLPVVPEPTTAQPPAPTASAPTPSAPVVAPAPTVAAPTAPEPAAPPVAATHAPAAPATPAPTVVVPPPAPAPVVPPAPAPTSSVVTPPPAKGAAVIPAPAAPTPAAATVVIPPASPGIMVTASQPASSAKADMFEKTAKDTKAEMKDTKAELKAAKDVQAATDAKIEKEAAEAKEAKEAAKADADSKKPQVLADAPTTSRVAVRATQSSWVMVIDSSGKTIYDHVLKPGESYKIPNKPGLSLTTGNGSGIVLSLDGADLPRVAIGAPHVVRNIALDPDRLTAASASASAPSDH